MYVNQVLTGNLTDQKPFLYARFIQLFSLGGRWIPAAIVAQILVAAGAFARMLCLLGRTRMPTAGLACYLILLLNPYVAMMLTYVQNDPLFSVAVAALTCEAAYAARRREANWPTLLVFGLYTPMALLFRENGKVFMAMLWAVIAITAPTIRRRTLLASAAGVAAVASGAIGVDFTLSQRHLIVYPMVIHEVVNVARPVFEEPLGTRLSPEIRASIGEERLAQAVEWYSPDHWDSIAFVPGGPKLLDLDTAAKGRIVTAFLRHDLWTNLPAVLGHRVQLFLTAATAGRPIETHGLPRASLEALHISGAPRRARERRRTTVGRLYQFTVRNRALLWSPLPGAALVVALCAEGLVRRDRIAVGIGVLLATQAALVALFAPAAEFRYLFLLYLAAPACWIAWPRDDRDDPPGGAAP